MMQISSNCKCVHFSFRENNSEWKEKTTMWHMLKAFSENENIISWVIHYDAGVREEIN